MSRVGTRSLAVTDFWGNHVPSTDPIVRAFIRHGLDLTSDVRRSSVTVASVFGREHWKSRGRVVIFSGEAFFRDRFADYSIDCRFSGRSNHLRLPPWAHNALGSNQPRLPQDEVVAPALFCNFIYSNPRSEMRNAFFELLNAKRAVDSLGSLMNNRVEPRLSGRYDEHWHSTKAAVLSDYRFTIAFENTELPGYTTEKMIDAWMAGSVPIYWGNPAFTVDFPPDSCLSLYEAGSLSKLVDQVLEAENEPERYAQLQAANPFRTGLAQEALSRYRHDLSVFVNMVADDEGSTAGVKRIHAKAWRRSRLASVARGLMKLGS